MDALFFFGPPLFIVGIIVAIVGSSKKTSSNLRKLVRQLHEQGQLDGASFAAFAKFEYNEFMKSDIEIYGLLIIKDKQLLMYSGRTSELQYQIDLQTVTMKLMMSRELVLRERESKVWYEVEYLKSIGDSSILISQFRNTKEGMKLLADTLSTQGVEPTA